MDNSDFILLYLPLTPIAIPNQVWSTDMPGREIITISIVITVKGDTERRKGKSFAQYAFPPPPLPFFLGIVFIFLRICLFNVCT